MSVVALSEHVSPDDLIDHARKLVPSIFERVARIADERRVTEDVFKDLQKAGEILFALSGGRALGDGSSAQRSFRHLSSITVHPGANWDSPALSFGSVTLGEGPLEFLL